MENLRYPKKKVINKLNQKSIKNFQIQIYKCSKEHSQYTFNWVFKNS